MSTDTMGLIYIIQDIYNTYIIQYNKYKYIKMISYYISRFHTVHEHPIELFFFTNDLIESSKKVRKPRQISEKVRHNLECVIVPL